MQHMKGIWRTASLLLAFTALRGDALAPDETKIDRHLLDLLKVSSPGDLVEVTLRLERQAHIPGILESLESQSASRRETHAAVIRALREVAGRTQPPVLSALEQMQREGKIRSARPYWISNIIEVKCRVDAVIELSMIEGVGHFFLTPKPTPVGMVTEGALPAGAASAEPGPRVIGADSLWRLGITGVGRVVGHIDTGVDGSHPALSERWRGNFAPADECWLAPGTDFPFDSTGHGTATMGVLAGRDSDTGDTTGVAIDALWIAARWGFDQYSVSRTEALQWMADPDSDPETTDDVPDVVSNSWFYGSETICYQTDWDVIDNLEAAGVCAMFSAGNAGPSPQTVASPASRNTSETNGFAVGAVDTVKSIADFSSRGPSPCDGSTKKPEVSAPGVSARTARHWGGYTLASGTSISCPFAAGIVALIRQLDPEATVEEIKQAILVTALDRGAAGDDNAYGMGVVNAYQAAQHISPYRVQGTVSDAASGIPLGGAAVFARETGQSIETDIYGHYDLGALLEEVSLITRKFGYFPDTSEVLSLGGPPLVHDVELVPIARSGIEGTVIDTTTGEGVLAGLILHANGAPVDTAFTDPESGSFRFGNVPVSTPPLVTYTGILGRFLLPYPSMITYPDTIVVEEGATTFLRLAAAPARVLIADDDDGANYEMYIASSIDTAGWTSYLHDVVGEGETVVHILDEFPAGTILVWYTGRKEETLTPEEEDSLGAFLARGGKLLLTGQNIAEDLASHSSPFLAEKLHAGFGGNTDLEIVAGFGGDPVFHDLLLSTAGPNGASDQYSRDVLVPDGVSKAACFYAGAGGGRDTVVAGLLIDDPNTSGARIVFLGFGFEAVNRPSFSDSTFTTRSEAMERILAWLEGSVGVNGGEGEQEQFPRALGLSQNFPNPFNPATTIAFDIPQKGNTRYPVTLSIFDIRGRTVRILLDESLPAGRHRVVWNGRDGFGRPVSSGVYLYRLVVDTSRFTRKMLLLR